VASRCPGILTFVAVAAIVIGVLTVFTALSNVFTKSVPFAHVSAAPEGVAKGPNAAILAAQMRMQERIAEIKQRHRGFFLLALPFSLLGAGMMILGGTRAFSLRGGARPLLLAGMAAGLVVGLLSVKPQIETQVEVGAATSTMIKAMFDAMDTKAIKPGPARTMFETMATMSKASATAGVATAVVFAFAKLGFLIFGLIYLTRARTRAVFAAPDAPTPPPIAPVEPTP
jgi:hypothetical protein